MAALVKIELEVTPETAAALEDPMRRRSMGVLVSRIVREGRIAQADELARVFREIGEKAQAAGLTEEMVDAELAAYNAERRR